MKRFNLEAAKRGEKVQTRDGRSVRILCFDRIDKEPIVALVISSGRELLMTANLQGQYLGRNTTSPLDLVIAPTKREGWINLYKIGNEVVIGGRIFNSILDAEAHNPRHSTIKIEWEE